MSVVAVSLTVNSARVDDPGCCLRSRLALGPFAVQQRPPPLISGSLGLPLWGATVALRALGGADWLLALVLR